MLVAKYEQTYLQKHDIVHFQHKLQYIHEGQIFEVTLHFEREDYKLPFPMKYKQPFKFIPWREPKRSRFFLSSGIFIM